MASAVFAKLNLKDHKEIVVLNAPDSFGPELKKLSGVSVRKSLTRAAEGDAIIWFAYPKGSSKRYKSEINRDRGWKALGAAGFEGVRMVAIDEDWSAVRFRRVQFIKTMNRHVSGAMTTAGKARTSGNSRR